MYSVHVELCVWVCRRVNVRVLGIYVCIFIGTCMHGRCMYVCTVTSMCVCVRVYIYILHIYECMYIDIYVYINIYVY